MTLRLGFVAVIRPLFKGDSPGAAGRSLESLRRIGEEQGFEVVTPHLARSEKHAQSGLPLPPFAVHDEGSAVEAAARLEALDLDMLLVQLTTFATGEVLAPLLRLPPPICLWALPERSGGRGESGPLPLNSLCGLNMTLSFLEQPPVSREMPVKWLYGEADSEWFRRRLAPTLTALRGLKAVKEARVLQVGGTAPHFYGLEEEPALPGVAVERMELTELFERVGEVAEREARALAADWRRQEQVEVDEEQLSRSAALELALVEIVDGGGFHAVALRCWPELPELCGTMACATLARLGDGGIAAACEGDVMGAVSMLALQGAGGEGSLLMDLSDIDDERGAFFWHCGNGPRSWASPAGTRLATHFNRDGVGTVRDMAIRSGPATGLRLLRSGRSAAVFAGDFRDTTFEDAGFDGIRGWLDELSWAGEKVSPRRFLSNVLDRRLPHHFALGSGDLSEGMIEMCRWLGSEVVPATEQRNTL